MRYIIRQDDISVLPMSVRSQNCLRRAGIHTIGAMLDYPADKLVSIRNMGAKSIEEICSLTQSLINGTAEYVLMDNPSDAQGASIIASESSHSTNTTIFFGDTGEILQDVHISALPLSVRAKNALITSGYAFASQLMGLSLEELLACKNMGKKSADDVLACVASFSVEHASKKGASSSEDAVSIFFSELATEMNSAYGGGESAWLRELITTKAQFPEAMGETLLYRLYDSEFVRNAIKKKILRHIEASNEGVSKTSLAEKLPSHLENTTIFEEVLLELEAESVIEVGEVSIATYLF